MNSIVRLAVATAAVSLLVGCVKYPVVKAEFFNPRPKLAVVSFQSEAVAEGTLGLPIKVAGIDGAYQVFASALEEAQYELVSTEAVRGCQQYFQLPKPLIDMGTTAQGLERVQLTSKNAAGLAQCVGADVVVGVFGHPKVEAGFQVAGVGTSKVSMLTHVIAWNNDGQEIWRDRLNTKSDSFAVAGKVMDPQAVADGGIQALKLASTQAVQRFGSRLAETPGPMSGEPAEVAADSGEEAQEQTASDDVQ